MNRAAWRSLALAFKNMPTTKRKEREAQRGLGSVKRMGQPPVGAVAYNEERALYVDHEGIVLTPEVVVPRRRERKAAAARSRKSPSTKRRRALNFEAVAIDGDDADGDDRGEEDDREGDGAEGDGQMPAESGK